MANNSSNNVSLIDLTTLEGTIIPVGTFPLDVEIAEPIGLALVTNFGSDTVHAIDVEGKQVVDVIRVGSQPTAAAFDPNTNRLYVANFGDNSITVVEVTETGHRLLTTIRGVPKPQDLKLSSDGRTGYAVVTESEIEVCLPFIGCTTQREGAVRVVDLPSRQLLSRIPIEPPFEPRQLALSPDGQRLYATAVSSQDRSGRVFVIDPVTGQIVQQIPVGSRPYGIAASADGCFVVVANIDSNGVSVIDAKKGELRTTLRDPQARGPFGVAIWERLAAVMNHLSHNITFINLGACSSA